MFVYVSCWFPLISLVLLLSTAAIRSQSIIIAIYLISVNAISAPFSQPTRWGDKENGVAGHGDTEGHQYTPKLLERLIGKHVVQISACGFHTGCLTDVGEVRMTLVLHSINFQSCLFRSNMLN